MLPKIQKTVCTSKKNPISKFGRYNGTILRYYCKAKKHQMKPLFTLLLLLAFGYSHAQKRIDSSFIFDGEEKKFSIFIPQSEPEGESWPMILGLHPLNVSRWNAQAWCDTLVDFATKNKVLLICPDGGSDGRIDDPIDTAFTSALLDSAEVWYQIDPVRRYILGFSWGAKTTYTYGLSHVNQFAGFLPYGAAINSSEINADLAKNANGKPWYILHGELDVASQRFHPLVDLISTNGGIVQSKLLPNVGHTVDFNDRNKEFTKGYKWLDSIATNPSSVANATLKSEFVISQNEAYIFLKLASDITETPEVNLYALSGQKISTKTTFQNTELRMDKSNLKPQTFYILSIESNSTSQSQKIFIK